MRSSSQFVEQMVLLTHSCQLIDLCHTCLIFIGSNTECKCMLYIPCSSTGHACWNDRNCPYCPIDVSHRGNRKYFSPLFSTNCHMCDALQCHYLSFSLIHTLQSYSGILGKGSFMVSKCHLVPGAPPPPPHPVFS